ELWERFSYYGMRAILVLFMTAPLAAANAGLGFGEGKAGAIYGLYTSMVYLMCLPGGWVADKLWGQRRSVFVGGCIIAAGHFTMAGPLAGLPEVPTFYLGLALITIGTGLLKPNVSTLVGSLYPEGGARRDAGFSIYYMGINIGAILGPTICGLLGEKIDWHWGFSAAGFGMVLGLVQYRFGDRFFGPVIGNLDTGEAADVVARRSRLFYLTAGVVAAVAALFVYLATSGAMIISLEQFATWVGYGILLLAILFFSYLIFDVRWAAGMGVVWGLLVWYLVPRYGTEGGGQYATAILLALFVVLCAGYLVARRETVTLETRRLMVIFWLFLLAAVFWSGFEQAGSSMNLFARDLTDRVFFGWEMPTSWLQNVNPLFIVIFAPVFGWLWTWLANVKANPSIPVKFALGILGLAAGFLVLAWGAANASPEDPVSVNWLVVTYFLHTVGELCLSPVGLSSMTKLAPRGRVGQMMGVWFIGAALGNLIAGLVAGQLEDLSSQELFWQVTLWIGGAGLVALLLSPLIKKLMGKVD
ncbi:MAG TPA: peptide MFS transporter, partial [Thermoanaerobaculia bacterium]|nr:peptide MFS transporter [Thermoanaerobaculia bacterium]